jgi:hypothetical protein
MSSFAEPEPYPACFLCEAHHQEIITRTPLKREKIIVQGSRTVPLYVENGIEMKEHQAPPAPDFASSKPAQAQAKTDTAQGRSINAWYKKKRFMVPSALTVLLVIILAASGGLGSDILNIAKSDPQPTATRAATPVAPGIGTTAVDGDFSFVVTGVDRPGKTMPGKNHTTLTAKGEFIIVRVNVTNTGAAAADLDCQCQVLFNDKGTKYPTSPAILSTKDALKFVELIEPGITVKGAVMLFDVAPGTKLGSIELHHSRLTQGVMVPLP